MSHLAGTDLTFEIPLTDSDGVAIEAATVEYRVLDGEGVVLLAFVSLGGYVSGEPATVTISGAINTLPVDKNKAVREIEFVCTLASGAKKIASYIYFIESNAGTLIRGQNTLVTLAGAELLSEDIPDMIGWKSTTKTAKIAALMEGYRRLGNLRFNNINNFYYHNSGPFDRVTAISLLDLSVSEVLAIEPKVLIALAMAQVSEADFVLRGGAQNASRSDGVILETIGEVKKMYRSTKTLELPVSKRTFGYLSPYTTLASKVIGRAS